VDEGARIPRPTPRALAGVVALGFAHALWALFQWTQLVASRTGGSSFCGLGESTTCAEVWDSPFATLVQDWTGVPIAGWGLVWSLAAFGLPLWTLAARAGGSRDEDGTPNSFWLATLWVALAGVAGVISLIIATLSFGALCLTCSLTYAVVVAYAATCFAQTPPFGRPIRQQLVRGLSPAVVAIALSLAVVFVPGLRTPMNHAAEGRKALLKLAGERDASGGRTSRSASADPAAAGGPPLEGLRVLLAELPAQLRQVFADELLRYASAEAPPIRTPRALIGPPAAMVRLTEFTDALCTHCATLHETVSQLQAALPPGSFNLEARHFPLDSACNAEIEGESTTPVRCLAARASICMEGHSGAFAFAGRIYEHQQGLTEEQVFQVASQWMPREELSACVESPETDAKLQDDVAWATEHGIEGTPMVLLDGRPAAPFGPLLFALILTQGDTTHPIFASLPEGVLRDPHEGHDH
jgi:hypothetical protein